MDIKTCTLEEQKANRKRWVRALRSGNYRQVRGGLKTSYGYCCLGVLEELFGEFMAPSLDDLGEYYRNCDGCVAAPSLKAMAAVGLASCSARLPVNTPGGDSLVSCNDSGVSFNKIADLVEVHEDAIFVNKNPPSDDQSEEGRN